MRLKFTIIKFIILLVTVFTFGISVHSVLASSLSLSPGSGSIPIGGTTTVVVRLNTAGEAVNAVSAFLSYPQDKVEVAWVSGGSAFAIEAEKSYGGGIIKVSRGNINPVSGNVNVATIGLRGKAEGDATLSFIGGSAAPRASDSSDSLNLGSSRGGTYKVGGAVAKVIPKSGDSALVISEIQVKNISTRSAVISWKTDMEADSAVDCGLEIGKYFLNITNTVPTTSHSLKIEHQILAPGHKIHCQVRSKTNTGDLATSPDTPIQLLGYKVLVKVRNSFNQPVLGAEVWLYSDPLQAKTNNQGEAVFENVTLGKHLVVVKDKLGEKSSEIEVKETAAAQTIDLRIDNSTNIMSGNPILIFSAVVVATLIVVLLVFLIIYRFRNKTFKKMTEAANNLGPPGSH